MLLIDLPNLDGFRYRLFSFLSRTNSVAYKMTKRQSDSSDFSKYGDLFYASVLLQTICILPIELVSCFLKVFLASRFEIHGVIFVTQCADCTASRRRTRNLQ